MFLQRLLTKDWPKMDKPKPTVVSFSLKELRKGKRLRQKQIAHHLKTVPSQISRLENANDMLVSSLKTYVEALGGKLIIIAEFESYSARISLDKP